MPFDKIRSVLTFQRIEIGLTSIVVIIASVLGIISLSRGVWLDEFFTLMITRSDSSFAEFARAVSREPHPILHYGLVYSVQKLGPTDVVALRALNILGALGFAALLFAALRRKAITPSEACVIATLYASSSIFVSSFAEVRSYFLLFSASLAATIAWKISFDATVSPALRRGDWIWYLVALGMVVNLHYFGTLYGGFLTFSLIAHAASLRDWRRATTFALVGAAAAAPAVITFYIQSQNVLQPEFNSWIQTTFMEGARYVREMTGMAVGMNYVVLAASLMGALFLVDPRNRNADTRWMFWLAATLVAFLAFVTVANIFRPFVWLRYLYAAAGSVVVLAAALSTQHFFPRITASAVCAAALIAQCFGIYKPSETYDGWRTSAIYVAQTVEQCPSTKVYAMPWITDASAEAVLTPWLMFGYNYYADRYSFEIQQLSRGEEITSQAGPCPTLIWIEYSYDYFFHAPGASTERTLRMLNIPADRNADVRGLGSGIVVTLP